MTSRCRSVNYFKGAHFCEINFQIHTIEPEMYRQSPGWIYTAIERWNKDLVRSCSSSSCALNEKCILQPFGEFRCVFSDCGILNVQNTTWNVQDWDGIGIYQHFHIKCSDFHLQRGSGRFLCLENGTWKSDLICLDLPRDCKNLRENGDNDSRSGVYEIYPYGSRARPATVFCDMYTMGGGWTEMTSSTS
ncbi:uncharacterized protein LOC134230335 [Saccostrea cucullata]|uniref:uncharacterized protein LOC134230335 n=1 Tax=Saccostrea cuccullata TaxID=36930 RepID=UPI002ED51362